MSVRMCGGVDLICGIDGINSMDKMDRMELTGSMVGMKSTVFRE